jgi:ABC-type lipoprotein export system ATPase subunit
VSQTIVELRDVFCLHRTDEGDAAALQGTNLVLGRGESLCVLGPSGAGKSTLLRVVAGVEPPSAGIVQVLGHDVGRLPERVRARLRHELIGFVGQHSGEALSPDLTVRQLVELPLALRGVSRPRRRARVDELVTAAGLGERGAAYRDELSGGERQRVALCAALAHRPELLLADEPTGELDEMGAAAVRALIAELARADGASVLIVSHDPETATIAERSVRMRDGRIAEDRRAGKSAMVVSRGGWVQLPAELMAGAGITDRARVDAVDGGLLVRSMGGPGCATVAGAAADQAPIVGWSAARVELRSLGRVLGRGAGRRQVLRDLTLAIAAGRMTVVQARSGAGKTTMLRILGGLDPPDEGDLLIDGCAVGRLDAEARAKLRRDRIGYLPQEPSPVGFLTAEENVVLALRMRGWEPEPAARRAALALGRVGLADRACQRVSRLSAGERQRVALARALASARGLLLVDEPTSRVDGAGAAAVAELLVSAAAQERQTVVCATHDPEVIRRADAVVALPG